MRAATIVPPLRAMLLAMVLVSPAAAVVITSSDDTPNLSAPGNDPGWLNVGHVGTASGVYLGNRWVITANHVGDGALRLSDGRSLALSIGSGMRLSNPSGTLGSPDLRMFRLAEDPGLPALNITESTPEAASRVTMIGAGLDRDPHPVSWLRLTSGWTEVPPAAGNVHGYNLESSATMRWGVNLTDRGSFTAVDGASRTLSFSTRFDSPGIPFEAQATPGDSGGGAFMLHDGVWELAGIMTSASMLNGQPSGTVVFGEQTVMADLSAYRSLIMELLDRDEPLWQNQANHYDVGGTGHVSTRDLLLVINELLSEGPRELDGAPGAADFFLDVNGDYRLSVGDAQQVITALLTGTASRPGPTGANAVPEPSTALLAASGAALAGWGLLRRRRASRHW